MSDDSAPAFGTPMSFSVYEDGGVQVVRLGGSVGMHEAEELQVRLPGLVRAGASRLVLDLCELEFVSSMGLSAIVSAHHEARKLGGRLCIVGPRPAVANLLRITRIDQVIAVYSSVQAALSALTVR